MDPAPLCNAIWRRKIVRFDYHAERRTVLPHIVFASRTGNILLSGTEPPRKGWRTYDLSDIAEFEILDRSFRPDRGFRPGNYENVICCVERR